jgi:hypothetical protein
MVPRAPSQPGCSLSWALLGHMPVQNRAQQKYALTQVGLTLPIPVSPQGQAERRAHLPETFFPMFSSRGSVASADVQQDLEQPGEHGRAPKLRVLALYLWAHPLVPEGLEDAVPWCQAARAVCSLPSLSEQADKNGAGGRPTTQPDLSSIPISSQLLGVPTLLPPEPLVSGQWSFPASWFCVVSSPSM